MKLGGKTLRTKRDFKEACKEMQDELAIFRDSEDWGIEFLNHIQAHIDELTEDEAVEESDYISRHFTYHYVNHLTERMKTFVRMGHRIEVPREDVKVMKDNVIDINNAKSNRGRK